MYTKESIMIVLGHLEPLVQIGLTQVLCEDHRLHIIGTDLDEVTLERVVAERAPRVAILDATAAYSHLARLRATYPATEVLILAHDPTRAYEMRLLSAGVTCISLSAAGADILATVHCAAEGGDTFALASDRRVGHSDLADVRSLTPREGEVLAYLRKGSSYPEIALALQIGVETVRTHARRILRKLDVRSKRELIGVPTFDGQTRELLDNSSTLLAPAGIPQSHPKIPPFGG